MTGRLTAATASSRKSHKRGRIGIEISRVLDRVPNPFSTGPHPSALRKGEFQVKPGGCGSCRHNQSCVKYTIVYDRLIGEDFRREGQRRIQLNLDERERLLGAAIKRRLGGPHGRCDS
jgi:hypothetical protein